uniref:Uncharacterized protein n=1 Tax=viral metagenome TaxID=1070528 RepID=A0A2V0RJ05_9ZZZZ
MSGGAPNTASSASASSGNASINVSPAAEMLNTLVARNLTASEMLVHSSFTKGIMALTRNGLTEHAIHTAIREIITNDRSRIAQRVTMPNDKGGRGVNLSFPAACSISMFMNLDTKHGSGLVAAFTALAVEWGIINEGAELAQVDLRRMRAANENAMYDAMVAQADAYNATAQAVKFNVTRISVADGETMASELDAISAQYHQLPGSVHSATVNHRIEKCPVTGQQVYIAYIGPLEATHRNLKVAKKKVKIAYHNSSLGQSTAGD